MLSNICRVCAHSLLRASPRHRICALLQMASPSAEADVASSRQSEGSLAQLCLKCKEEIDSSTVAATTQAKRRYHQGLDADCQECMKNYKSLTRRWKGNKKLHQWWLNLSEEDKTTWFVKEKRLSSELSAAQKRANQRKLSVSFTSTKSVGKRDATQVHFKPWALVKRDLMMEGMTKEEAISEWRRRCMSKDFKKRKISGEWCIGEFAGAIVESYNDEANEASVEALFVALTSSPHLASLQVRRTHTCLGKPSRPFPCKLALCSRARFGLLSTFRKSS